MKHSEKEILFYEFLKTWENDFNKLPYILKYLNSYTICNELFPKSKLINENNLFQSQLEWVALCAQMQHIKEKSFFKPYWVPIEKDNYDYFIDLSSNPISIFEVDYSWFLPRKWIKINIGENLSDVMCQLDSDYQIRELIESKNNSKSEVLLKLLKKQYDLGLCGKIDPGIIPSRKIFNQFEPDYVRKGNTIKVKNVTHMIVSLLSIDLQIVIKSGLEREICNKIKQIKGLLYYFNVIDLNGNNKHCFDIEFKKGCYATYANNSFVLHHYDKCILDSFIGKLEKARLEHPDPLFLNGLDF